MLKQKTKSLCALALAGVMLASLVAGCGGSGAKEPAKTASKEPIKFGIIGPYTGPNAKPGQSMKQGVNLAVEEINKAGGIKGRQLAALFEDDASVPARSLGDRRHASCRKDDRRKSGRDGRRRRVPRHRGTSSAGAFPRSRVRPAAGRCAGPKRSARGRAPAETASAGHARSGDTRARKLKPHYNRLRSCRTPFSAAHRAVSRAAAARMSRIPPTP